jgi:DNA-binding NarL/FixJ family response regulator
MGVRVVLADSQVLFRGAVRALLVRTGSHDVLAEASDGHEALARIREHLPDLVLIELGLPGIDGAEVIRQSKDSGGAASFLVLSGRDGRREVEDALSAGASGFISKEDSADELLAAIDAVGNGGRYFSSRATRHLVDIALGRSQGESGHPSLSTRECEILRLIAEGMSSKEISEALHVSIRTVDSHRANLMEKLGLHKVASLVRYAIREGLINP